MKTVSLIATDGLTIVGSMPFAWILFMALSCIGGFLFIKSYRKLKKDIADAIVFSIASAFAVAFSGASALTFTFGDTGTSVMALACAFTIAVFVAGADIGTLAFASTCSIGWFISIGMTTGQWLPLLISIMLLCVGILFGYLYERVKAVSLA